MNNSNKSLGLMSAIGAFGMWGVLPVYWKQLSFIEPVIILIHRFFWSFIFLTALLLKAKNLRSTLALLKNKRHALIILLRSILLAFNWGIFIWAVNNNHIIETSLGYFLNPLLNTLFGIIFFRERPDFLQKLAIFLAFTGVSVQTILFGSVPIIALSLASLFAAYGAIRKKDNMPATEGLFLETTLLLPLVLVALIWFILKGSIGFDRGLVAGLLIVAAGPLTSIPLIMFAYSTQRLNLTTVGLAQYISPTLTLLTGTFIYNEQLGQGQIVSFIFIWAALLIYSFESIRLYKRSTKLDWRDAGKNK
ncbi:MAG: EamA family transporter RarD [Deltaproteobacteria bacterium]|jgi:chloramphenicol-sensitive protein RarD|nr:EamA family transporter RarD [Deltaproteobacteria bacterium]